MNADVHGGKTMAGKMENGGGRRMSRWRMAAWAAAALFLLANWVAMQFTDEVNWTVGDFVFAGALMFGALGAYEVAVRMTGNAAYRTGVGVAIVAAFLLVWINAAVGITDSAADGMYIVVLAIGIVGALVARFRPDGMARAMLATALATASVGVIALIAGIVPAYNSAFEILGLNGFFVVLWVGSAMLFREAARGGPERGAV
jgi:hypothetical protein